MVSKLWEATSYSSAGMVYFVLCPLVRVSQKWWSLGDSGIFYNTKMELCLLQTCQTPMRPITPNNLLDSICWSISEPTSAASIYTDSLSVEDPSENHSSIFFDAKGVVKDSEVASFSNSTRSLTERLLTFSVSLDSSLLFF